MLVRRFGAGELKSAKGIAEGVENTNYLVETDQGRFIFTVYEKRVNVDDLPFFMALIDHLVAKGCAVPPALKSDEGTSTISWNGKAIAMMTFMPGLSVTRPNAAKAHSVGMALGEMHRALADFSGSRPNTLGPDGWYALAERCGADLDAIQPGLRDRVARECDWLKLNWPHHLPKSVIHADLFPDNVLMVGDKVGSLIDFYFACTEVRAWDVAVTHAAWSFDPSGTTYRAAIGDALLAGYQQSCGLSEAEQRAFPALARGACLRFVLTRAWDWLNTPATAMVTRKDPLDFVRRLDHYAAL